jgi:hypothetical protein
MQPGRGPASRAAARTLTPWDLHPPGSGEILQLITASGSANRGDFRFERCGM